MHFSISIHCLQYTFSLARFSPPTPPPCLSLSGNLLYAQPSVRQLLCVSVLQSHYITIHQDFTLTLAANR